MAKELTLDVARDMYATGNEAMMEYALEFFSEELLKNKNNTKLSNDTFPRTYEEAIMKFPSVLRIGFKPYEIESRLLGSQDNWSDYIWMVSDDMDMPLNFIQLSCVLCMRNAWWKVDNNWKPENGDLKYVITCKNDEVIAKTSIDDNYILSFRSEEIRDLFMESFSDLLENTKEFL